MKLTVIACEVFRREFEALAASLPHEYTFHFQPFALHDTPTNMKDALQEVVDTTTDADRILLAYGLCSRGIVGLTARETEIVIPRAHDCITLFLGSRERYRTEFDAHPGTYYYSAGWIDKHNPNAETVQFRPDSAEAERARAAKYAMYVEKYGEDNAKYLIEMESQWQEHYSRVVFIDTGVGNREYYRDFVRHRAERNGWTYEELDGDTGLMRRFLAGEWDDDFLILPPGHAVRDAMSEEIIRVEALQPMNEAR